MKIAGEVDIAHDGGIHQCEINDGKILACCSRPNGPVEVDVGRSGATGSAAWDISLGRDICTSIHLEQLPAWAGRCYVRNRSELRFADVSSAEKAEACLGSSFAA